MSRIFITIMCTALGACRSSAPEDAVHRAPSAEPSSPVAARPVVSEPMPLPLQLPATASTAPAIPTRVTASASTKHQETHRFVCPMHPNVVRHAPGDCPECGMHLVAPN